MRETLKTTTNSSVYRKILTRRIIKEYNLCLFCFQICGSKYGGENLVRQYQRNWKKYRRHQWKVEKG